METNKEITIFTIGAQMGDTESDHTVGPHLLLLKKLIRKFCRYRYMNEVDRFAPILRVDGDIWHWNLEGCYKLRLMRKYGYITMDIYMPRSKWQGATTPDIRTFLITNMKQALQLMVNKLKKEHIDVNEKRLFEDFAKVEQEYLSESLS
jgi:hypothetical protein